MKIAIYQWLGGKQHKAGIALCSACRLPAGLLQQGFTFTRCLSADECNCDHYESRGSCCQSPGTGGHKSRGAIGSAGWQGKQWKSPSVSIAAPPHARYLIKILKLFWEPPTQQLPEQKRRTIYFCFVFLCVSFWPIFLRLFLRTCLGQMSKSLLCCCALNGWQGQNEIWLYRIFKYKQQNKTKTPPSLKQHHLHSALVLCRPEGKICCAKSTVCMLNRSMTHCSSSTYTKFSPIHVFVTPNS